MTTSLPQNIALGSLEVFRDEINTFDTNSEKKKVINKDTSVNIVFLSASSGGGHHAVAQSLSNIIGNVEPTNCHIVDLYADEKLKIFPKLATLRAKSSRVWTVFLWLTDNPMSIRFLWFFFKRRFIRSVKKQLTECPITKPDIIIATHHAAAHCLAEIAAVYKNRPKTIVFVTDYGIHQSWVADADLTIVASTLAYKALKQQKRRVLLVPLLPCASGTPNTIDTHDSVSARQRELGSDNIHCIALMGLDGTSEYKIKDLLNTLDKQIIASKLSIDIICGKNVLLREQLAQWRWARLNVNVLGLVDDVPSRLEQADLALLRLSPQIMTESLVACTPIIAFDWHYHERQNIRVLRHFGAGDGSLDLAKQIDLIRTFCENSEYRRRWQQAATRVSENRIDSIAVTKIMGVIQALPESRSNGHEGFQKNIPQSATSDTSSSSVNSWIL